MATRLSVLLEQLQPNKKFTFIVPSNSAWEKVKRDFSTIFASLVDINNPEFVSFPPKDIIFQTKILLSSRQMFCGDI